MVCETIESLCRVSKDGFATQAGELIELREWQRRLIYEVFARRPDGRFRHRTVLIGMPRKNGKSALASGFALDGLLFGGNGSDVYSCAADMKQARIVWGETKKMIMAEPELKELCRPLRDVIEVPSTNSIYQVLSAEAYTKEGLNPSRVLFDEVHAQPTDELWNVMVQAKGARVDSLTIGITTAGVMLDSLGQETICYQLYRHGVDIALGVEEDPSFYMVWWGAPEGADYRNPEVWAGANPGYGDLIDPEDFAATLGIVTEADFRTKRLNQWISSAVSWLPFGAWDACKQEIPLEEHSRVFLGFDGSYNGDSTALVAATPARFDEEDADGNPVMTEPVHLYVLEYWEKDPNDPNWKINIADVEAAVEKACLDYDVVEIVCDPYRWGRSMEKWDAMRLPVVEFPQSPSRMTPATTRFYEAVMNHLLTHDGNLDLARHMQNAILKVDARGQRLAKESKMSGRRIDLAVAALMAYERASRPDIAPEVWSIAEMMEKMKAQGWTAEGSKTLPATKEVTVAVETIEPEIEKQEPVTTGGVTITPAPKPDIKPLF